MSPDGDTRRLDRETRDGSRGRAVRDHELAALIERLSAIREQLLEVAEGWRPWIKGRDADRDASARKLLQYLALRGHDLRELQDPLVALGLSSLGGSEGHVQASVEAVLETLDAVAHRPLVGGSAPPPMDFARSREVLAVRTAALLGPVPRRRPTRIMITMPTEAAHHPRWCARCSSLGWTA
jgi:pyruvate kinase